MMTLAKFFRWLAEKFAAAGLILAASIVAGALWLYLREHADLERWRQETIRSITGQRAELQAALGDVNADLARRSAEIVKVQNELHQVERVLAGLKRLDGTWSRLFGDPEQRRINAGRREAMLERRTAAERRLGALREQFTRMTWTRDGLEIALGRQDAQLKRVEAQRSKAVEYLQRAWNHPVGGGWLRMPMKHWVVIVLVGYFLGPSVGRLLLYFAVAPLVMRGRPVRLAGELAAMPSIGASEVAPEILLRPGERLWVKEKFLQASDEGLRRRTRTLLDWKIPLTCLAAGLIELIEMRHPGGTDAGERGVTLSNQADPHSELAIVAIPEGASLILRPSFLAGAIVENSRSLRIRRRWQLWRWQAWVTLQFRFFEFVGPCRLVLAGSRGVRVENLAAREGVEVPARRTNQDATVGFTPNLDYRPTRAETFWSYYRGMNPLFDDLFSGRGIFLCQQVATDGDARRARKFWSALWSAALKLFGL